MPGDINTCISHRIIYNICIIVSCAVRYIKKKLLTGYSGIGEFIDPLEQASPREIVVTRGIINLLLASY